MDVRATSVYTMIRDRTCNLVCALTRIEPASL